MTRSVFSGRSVSARGSAMLEFVLAVTLVVLPLISGILEFAQLATARHILAFATQEAARSEAIAAMDERSNIVRLDALVASFFDAAGTRSVDDSLRLSFARVCCRCSAATSHRASSLSRVSSSGSWRSPRSACRIDSESWSKIAYCRPRTSRSD